MTQHGRRSGLPLLVALLVLGLHAAEVQGEEETSRPRIGLALGGGSSRGLAHVGVLRWLEEHRIPVDAIAGTSIGAFIGGCSAMGMSAGEIQTMLSSTDWELAMRSDLPYALRAFRRKEDERDRPIKVEMGLRQGLRLQSGLNSGHQMGLVLSRLTLPYSAVENFDDLPIRFRSTATDLAAGETVVLDHGPLGSAIRASMSLPGTFDPVWRDGRLLSDGGILNNVPVDAARAMGVDVVMAVSVSPRPRGQPSEGIQGIANRSIRLMMENLDRPSLEHADVVIRPDVEGIRGRDFERSEEIAARGYAAAAALSAQLLPYALDPAAWAKYQEDLQKRKSPRTGALSFVEVDGASEASATRISRNLSRDLSAAAGPDTIDAHLDSVIGRGRFSSAMYRRATRGDVEGVILDFREKSYAPPLVKFSLDVNNAKRDVEVTLGSRVTFLDPVGLGSEWRVDASLGSRSALATEVFVPLSGGGLIGAGPFIAPRGFYSRTATDLFANGALIALRPRQRAGGGLDLGWLFGRRLEARAGYEMAQVWDRSQIGEASLLDGVEKEFQLRLSFEGQDRAYLPTRGLRLTSRVVRFQEVPGAMEPFTQLEGTADVAWPVARGQHMTLHLEGVTEVDGAAPLLYQPGLGGALHVGSLPYGAFQGPHLVIGGLGYRLRLSRLPRLLGDSLYFTGLVEAGSAFAQASEAEFKGSATIGLTADTFLGPFFAGVSVGSGGSPRAYFLLGTSVR